MAKQGKKKKGGRASSSGAGKVARKKLEADLEDANARKDRWKKRAKKHEAAAADARARVAKLERKLAKARSRAESAEARAAEPTPADHTADPAPGDDAPAAGTGPVPDESWTVEELRAEARSRGLTGFSRQSKSELLSSLT